MEQGLPPDGHPRDSDPESVLDRLIGQFGEDAISSLAVRFAGTLRDGLAELDTGSVDGSAHRLAGIAGTLGFSDLSREWRALSEGDRTSPEIVRRESAAALAIIDRRWGSSPEA